LVTRRLVSRLRRSSASETAVDEDAGLPVVVTDVGGSEARHPRYRGACSCLAATVPWPTGCASVSLRANALQTPVVGRQRRRRDGAARCDRDTVVVRRARPTAEDNLCRWLRSSGSTLLAGARRGPRCVCIGEDAYSEQGRSTKFTAARGAFRSCPLWRAIGEEVSGAGSACRPRRTDEA